MALMATFAEWTRWAARLLSVGAAPFVLAFARGEGFRLSSFSSRSGTMLLLLLVGIVANVLAWRWELEGAAVALVALIFLSGVELVTTGRLPGCGSLFCWACQRCFTSWRVGRVPTRGPRNLATTRW